MKDLPEPTEKNILDLAAKLKERWQATHEDIAWERDLRWRRLNPFDGKIPEPYKATTAIYKTPEIQYNGQQAKALLLSNPPTVEVRTPRENAEALATKAERFCNAAYGRLEEATHADEKNVDTQIHYYAAVKKCYPRRDRWPDYPQRMAVNPGERQIPTTLTDDEGKPRDETDKEWNKRTEDYKQGQALLACFEYTDVPIDTLFWPPEDSHGIPAIMEIKKVNEWELMERFGIYRTSEGEYVKSESGARQDESEPGREAEVYEYWNRQWRALLVKGTKSGLVLDTWKHDFGRVPYFIAGAYRTGETAPELQHIPLLWALYPEAEENNRLHTMRSNVAYMYGFPTYYVKTAQTGQMVLDDQGKPKVFITEPGKAPQLGPGQEAVPFNLPSGFDLQAALMDSDERIKRYALPPIATGNAPSGDSAGWNTQMLRHFLVTLLDPLVSGRAQQMAELWRFVLQSIKEVIGETVYVNEEVVRDATRNKTARRDPIGISPNDIVDYDISVHIDPELEMNAISREEHGLNMRTQGGVSQWEFVEKYRQHPAPEEEIKRIDSDNAFNAVMPVQIQKIVDWLAATGAVDRVLGGESAEAVQGDMEQTEKGLGKGSAGMEREPGLRMPVSLPATGANPTFQPEEQGMGVPI